MPILERKIAHKMTTLCSHITYPELVLPLVKSVTPSRIKENIDVFDFELSQQEMFEIASLKADRIGSDPDTCDF